MEDKNIPPSLSKIGKAVLGHINRKDVAMRPRWHFLLQGILFITALLVGFAVVLFAGSLGIFIMRMNGTFFVPAFGSSGFSILFWSFPWLVAGFAAVVLLMLEYFVKRFPLAYRQPFLYSGLALLLVFFAGSFLADHIRLHRSFSEQALRRHVPFAEPFYRSIGGQEAPRVNVGTIAEWTSGGFVMSLRSGDEARVVVTRKTKLPFGVDLNSGDVVIVLGDNIAGVIVADGLRSVDDEWQFRSRMMRLNAPMMAPQLPY